MDTDGSITDDQKIDLITSIIREKRTHMTDKELDDYLSVYNSLLGKFTPTQ